MVWRDLLMRGWGVLSLPWTLTSPPGEAGSFRTSKTQTPAQDLESRSDGGSNYRELTPQRQRNEPILIADQYGDLIWLSASSETNQGGEVRFSVSEHWAQLLCALLEFRSSVRAAVLASACPLSLSQKKKKAQLCASLQCCCVVRRRLSWAAGFHKNNAAAADSADDL